MSLYALALDSRTIGLFHDDGIYVATAKSLAEGHGYRLENLPGRPYQTKYPPLYPWLLSLIWRVGPAFPRNIIWLKALNLAALAWLVAGSVRLARRTLPDGDSVAAGCVGLLIATAPGVVGFLDFTLSDVLFAALVVWGVGAPRPGSNRAGTMVRTALVASVAVLARSLGLCLAFAELGAQLRRRCWASAAVGVLVPTLVFALWTAWAAHHREPLGAMLAYYQEYETSAFARLVSDPRLALDIVVGNVGMAASSLPLVLGPAAALWPLLLPLMTIGAVWAFRRGWDNLLWFSGTYLAVVLGHPFSPHRYLVPLVPIVYVWSVGGAAWLDRRWRRPEWTLVRQCIVVAALSSVLLVANLGWLAWRLRDNPANTIRGWYGIDLGYQWDGFTETARWISSNTDPNDRIGSIFDPLYFLLTGRQAIRPWYHNPPSYFYPLARPKPDVGTPEAIAQELRRLGINYLVLDPPEGYVEGEVALTTLQRVVALDAVRGVRVFESRDGRHQVYRLAWHETEGTGGQPHR